MLGHIEYLTDYVNISVCCQKSDGEKEDPSVISLTIYSVSQADGGLSSVASRTPTKQDSKEGWFGWSEDISGYSPGQYVCLVEATVDSIATSWTDTFFVDDRYTTLKKIVSWISSKVIGS